MGTFIYFNTRVTIISRASAHLTSVSALAKKKLDLYFHELKLRIQTNVAPLSYTTVYDCNQKKLHPKSEDLCRESLTHLEDQFFPVKSNTNIFALRRGFKVWTFSHELLSKLLSQREGLGKTGEIYLVGPDRLMKSASRFQTEFRGSHVMNKAVLEGLQGKEGVEIVRDYRGIEVVSAFSPLLFDELSFVVMSEIDLSEVLGPAQDLLRDLFLMAITLSLVSAVIAQHLARSTVRQIDQMEQKIHRLNMENGMKILQVQEDERERIAFNLHDSAGQYVTAMKWELSRLSQELQENALKSKLKELSSMADLIIKEIRSISQDIMPSLIKDFGCFAAIKNFFSQQANVYQLRIDSHFPEESFPKLNYQFEVNLYRMIQELLQNAIRHSQATKLSFVFEQKDQSLQLIYEDDGIGIGEPGILPRSILYRVQLFHGKLEKPFVHHGLKYVITFRLEDICHANY